MFVLSLSAVLLSLRLASAMPFHRVVNEVRDTGVTAIALNERDMEYLAYRSDGTLQGRYPIHEDELSLLLRGFEDNELERRVDSTSCAQVSSDDVQKLPGWSKLTAYADSRFGTGSRQIVTNPPEYTDRGARACVDPAGAKIQADGPPTCSANTVTIGGSVVGTDGSVKFSSQQGFTSTSSWTVTSTGALAIAATVSAKFDIPLEVFKLSASVETTTTATFTNSQSTGFETRITNQVTQDLVMKNPPNKKCVATFTTKSCNVGGKGSVKLVASGWVWFNYDSATQENGQGDKHYKWAVSIEGVLPDAADRSSQVDVAGNMNASINSDFHGKCT